MSTKHLQTGDARLAFDNTKKFRIYSMKFCPFAQVCKKFSTFSNVNLLNCLIFNHEQQNSRSFAGQKFDHEALLKFWLS